MAETARNRNRIFQNLRLKFVKWKEFPGPIALCGSVQDVQKAATPARMHALNQQVLKGYTDWHARCIMS
jgi:hypothetical protein